MKALACKQPWAYALVDGAKTIEVRSRRTDYRGPLLITASAVPKNMFWDDGEGGDLRLLHAGCMIGVVDLIDCRLMKKADDPASLGAYKASSYAWVMKTRGFCVPGVLKSQLGIFDVPDSMVKMLTGDQWLFDFPTPQGEIKYRDSFPVFG